MTTSYLTITGKVQGVSYRWWMKKTAAQYDLAGWVRNSPDGSVQAAVTGPVDQVNSFIKKCYQGPSLAAVENIEVSSDPFDNAPVIKDGIFEIKESL